MLLEALSRMPSLAANSRIDRIVSLDLGMIEGAGYVTARPNIAQTLKGQGYVPVRLEELLALLEFNMTPKNVASGSRQLIIGIEPCFEDENNHSI